MMNNMNECNDYRLGRVTSGFDLESMYENMKFTDQINAEVMDREQLEEMLARSSHMISSAAEDRDVNNPDDYVDPSEYNLAPYELEELNKEV